MLLDRIQAPPLVIRDVEPEHLEGDMVQPGDLLFGLVWINLRAGERDPLLFRQPRACRQLVPLPGGGDTLDEFLDAFEGVTRDQAVGVIDLAARGLLSAS